MAFYEVLSHVLMCGATGINLKKMDRISIRINLFRWELIPFYTISKKLPSMENIKLIIYYVNFRFLCLEIAFKRTKLKS